MILSVSARRRVCRAVAAAAWTLFFAAVVRAADAGSAPPLEADVTAANRCKDLAKLPWPQTAEAQNALLRRLESASAECSADAQFQAALGGAWLELGDPQRALVRLERALLLNPALEAARADHALALAALGEPAARDELVQAWQGRSDVPPAVWRRLTQRPADQGAAAGAVADGAVHAAGDHAPTKGAWQQYRELQVLLGYESNLAQSPRLNELTISPPDGPLVLELETPLRPREGAATLVDAAWQAAYSVDPSRVYLFGAQASARAAPGDSDTNWHSLRATFGVTQRIGQWRGRSQLRSLQSGGRLFDRSSSVRWDLALEGPLGPCSQQLLLETERKHVSQKPADDGDASGLTLGLLCSAPRMPGWILGVFGRVGEDRARSELRAGGHQVQSSLAVRTLVELAASPGGRPWTLDFQWRTNSARDERGYSPLLESNARREIRSQQWQLEMVGPAWLGMPGRLETVLRVQYTRQRSNLAVFGYEAASAYGGVRARW